MYQERSLLLIHFFCRMLWLKGKAVYFFCCFCIIALYNKSDFCAVCIEGIA